MRKAMPLALAILLAAQVFLLAPQARATLYSIDSPLKPKVGESAAKIDGFIKYKRPDSPLVGLGSAWIAAAIKYNINQVYLFSHAILESGWGTSSIATDKKNIYGYHAYDRDPYGYAASFPSFAACIDFVVGKINANYLTPGGAYYHGATLRGMNVHYASDPSWGEKIARLMNLFADPIGASPAVTAPAGTPAVSSADCISFYNYGNANTAFWDFRAANRSGAIGMAPYMGWKSGPQGLNPGIVKTVLGDFNGDHVLDIMGVYNYIGDVTGFWLWTGKWNGGFSNPVKVYQTSGWDTNKAKLVAGDFDGNGRDELVAFYNYGTSKTGAFMLSTTYGGAFSQFKQVFYSPAWEWGRTRLISVKAGSKSQIVAAYNYGSDHTGLWQFTLGGDGRLAQPQLVFNFTQWSFDRSVFLGGDVGGDGYGDIIAAYNYGGARSGIFVFRRANASARYTSGQPVIYPDWDATRSKFVVDDPDRNGRADLTAFYDYGGGTMRAWLFRSSGTGLRSPSIIFQTPAGTWNNAQARWLARW